MDTTTQSLTTLSTRVSSLDLTCAHINDDTNLTRHHTTLLREQLKNAVDGLDIKIDVLEQTLSKRIDDSHQHFTQLETTMVRKYADSHQQLVDEMASVKSQLAAMVESFREFGADKNGEGGQNRPVQGLTEGSSGGKSSIRESSADELPHLGRLGTLGRWDSLLMKDGRGLRNTYSHSLPRPTRPPPFLSSKASRRRPSPKRSCSSPPHVDRTCSDHHFEEFPSVPISSGLLVQADEGTLLPVKDLIRRNLPPPTVKSQSPCDSGWSQAPVASKALNFKLPLRRRETGSGSGSATVSQQWYQSYGSDPSIHLLPELHLDLNFSDRKQNIFGSGSGAAAHGDAPSPLTPPAAAQAPPPAPPHFDRTCFDHHFEEFPSVLILSGLLVQADEGTLLPVVDLIRRNLPPPTVKSQSPCDSGWSQAPVASETGSGSATVSQHRAHRSTTCSTSTYKTSGTEAQEPAAGSITDSACKNQLFVVSVQYGPFNPYIPIRSTTIGKSRVAIDLIAMHTSWRSNSDIASVTSIGYPCMSASGESSTTKHRLLHASGSHPIPPPNDPKTNQYNQDLGLIHSTNGNHLESPNEGSSIDHQVTIYLHAQNITMFPTNEIWYFASQILVSSSGGLILILTAQSTRNVFRIHSDY
ncbi:hypothetical protein F511_33948 [Dorcoceras hygrometricum]|uniref:Uncharacterized protein n=1 Tax=Dorcoceras hygrometricum TaxID=472368 RepID=A0A2Z7CA28_9LAMI|nr:hypothetical protein F511_33948 [Dorcoceras hygrometricum]